MPSLEENKEIARLVAEAHCQGNSTGLRDLLAPDFVWRIGHLPYIEVDDVKHLFELGRGSTHYLGL
ncbi:hypothetical protein EPA93_16645 [Ktedonosporobacter rubrisoli]|uniref:Uncharacterized protein n=1 Tax=Ktedonosporobacter rubrisoli TaxID=2509675 RepID=A0A4V0YYV4_KTERU|nr:hypothetical protein [Ktedonosporobacter rubrisoli]QBD77531.1 hypothetical protein EPA93_16645 [Ktedonosporobacter rubrisoli]